jgi:DNA-directed RNA polymerase specialized sigma24 family protein
MKIRKRRRYEFLFEEVIETRSARRPPEVRSGEPTPEQQLLQRELQQFVARGLAELNPALSRVVELHYFEELTAQDCARALGISLSNAKARILRDKLRLRSTFNRHFRRRTTAFRPSCYPSMHFGPPSTIVAAALGRWAEQVEKRRH